MRAETKGLKKLIEKSNRILLLSHVHPDPDAISSLIFTLKILRKNFPNKVIMANVEEASLEQYKKLIDISPIKSQNTTSLIDDFIPDLIIILDIGESFRVSINQTQEEFRPLKAINGVVMIDHHNIIDTPDISLKINDTDNSCAETVYKVFIEEMKLIPDKNYPNELLLGIIGDTGSFSYMKRDSNIKSTFNIAAKLLEAGGSIDEVRGSLNRLNLRHLEVHKEYLKNLRTNNEFTYTYITDDFYKKKGDISDADYSVANNIFVQYYLKSIQESLWGFTIKPKGIGSYTVSFRSYMYLIDLSVFASKLGGNGHKASAGGLIQANSSEEAVGKVLEVIEKYKAEAYANK